MNGRRPNIAVRASVVERAITIEVTSSVCINGVYLTKVVRKIHLSKFLQQYMIYFPKFKKLDETPLKYNTPYNKHFKIMNNYLPLILE